MSWVLIFLLLLAAGFVAWNFVPSIRKRMSGTSTVLETIGGGVLYYFGVFAEGIEEAQAAGYIPDNFLSYVPYILVGYILLKRVQTTKPIKVPGVTE